MSAELKYTVILDDSDFKKKMAEMAKITSDNTSTATSLAKKGMAEEISARQSVVQDAKKQMVSINKTTESVHQIIARVTKGSFAGLSDNMRDVHVNIARAKSATLDLAQAERTLRKSLKDNLITEEEYIKKLALISAKRTELSDKLKEYRTQLKAVETEKAKAKPYTAADTAAEIKQASNSGLKTSGTVVNPAETERATQANKAYAASSQNVTNTLKGQAVASSQVKAANDSQMVSMQALKLELADYQKKAALSTDPAKLKLYNSEIANLQGEIARMSNVGKAGFDNMGNAIQKSTNLMGKAWGALRKISYIIPGLGIAGLLAFAIEPVMNFIKGLDLFKKKLSESQKEAENLGKALDSSEYKSAITSISNLTINLDLAKKGFYSKKTVIDEYNKSIGTVSGQVKTLGEVEQGLIDNADDYVKMTLYKAAANLALEEAATQALEAEKTRLKDARDVVGFWGKRGAELKVVGKTVATNLGFIDKQYDVYDKSLGERKNKEVEKFEKVEQEKFDLATSFQKKAANVAAGMGGVLGVNTGDKPAKTPGDKSVSAAENIYRKIADLKAEYTHKVINEDEAELEAVRYKFKRMVDEVNRFNKDPKNKVKVSMDELDEIRDAAITDLIYKQDTTKLKIEIEKQKDIFNEYEKFKLETAKNYADERYGAEKASFDSFEDYLKSQKTSLTNTSEERELTGGEIERLKYINQQLAQEQANQRQLEAGQFIAAFEAAKTHTDRLEEIQSDYYKKVAALGDKATMERLSILDKEKEAAIRSANDEAFLKTEIYKKSGEEALVLTRAQLKEQIKAIEELLSDGSIVGGIKDRLERELSSLKINLNIGAKSFNLDNLKAEKDNIQKAIDEYLKINKIGAFDSLTQSAIDSNPELKKLIDKLKEVATAILEVKKTADDGGKGLKGFLAKLTDDESLVKFTEWGAMAAGAFSDMSSALGGVDTEAGYALDTVSQLVGSAAEIGGAIASGDPVKIVGSIVKGIATVFSIGRKVKEMNEAARQSIADFYAQAIAGEREYQNILNQRAVDSVRDNKVRLQGIRDEIALRKIQASSDKKEFDDTMRKIKGQSYIKEQEYKHGTWFRKAKVTNVMGSLQGKSFEELSSLLSQGKLEGETAALVQRLVELEQKGYDATKALADLAKETAEIFTGTTADNLTDSLANMFKEGKTGVKDLADFFESTMQDAAMSIFKNKVLAELMSDFYDDFSKAAESDDELTAGEIETLRTKWVNDTAAANKKWDQYQEVTGLPDTNNSGSGSNNLTNRVANVEEVCAKELQSIFSCQD